jgi:cell division protein FtsB
MKALTLIFVVLIALLQYPLWLGKGSWLRVWNVNQQISVQKDKNVALKLRNETLQAEVRDLKQGNAAIEERARTELGMIKQDEVFYQVIDQALPIAPANQLPVGVAKPANDTNLPVSSSKEAIETNDAKSFSDDDVIDKPTP